MLSLQNIFSSVLLVAATITPAAASSLPPLWQPSATSTSSLATMATLAKADDPTTTTAAATATITDAPTPLNASAPYTSEALFTSAILNSTNTYRRQHNASALVWNSTLTDFAADYLANDTTCKFAHSGGPYGENIAIGFRTPQAAIEVWGNERRLYDFDNPGFHENTGHFTQLVWKKTTAVGCARMYCGGPQANQVWKGWFVVCEYWPRGNIIGRFAEQVDRQVEEDDDDDGGGGGTESGATVSGGTIGAAVLLSVLLAMGFLWDILDTTARL